MRGYLPYIINCIIYYLAINKLKMIYVRLLVLILFYSFSSLSFAQNFKSLSQSKDTNLKLIIDSNIDTSQIFEGLNCPIEILNNQRLINVKYYSFDNNLHQGQLVMHKDLIQDIQQVFALAVKIKFPINSVIPMSNIKFRHNNLWSDDLSMLANNTSAFNYRTSTNTKSRQLSMHAYGRAIDINPVQNPYIKNHQILPINANYNLTQKGTLNAQHPITLKFLQLGWKWGGNWQSVKDYQHFEK